MGVQETLNQAAGFAKDSQESQDVAAEQRVANNAIQKAQLNILKFIACTVFLSALSLIPVVVGDHYSLIEFGKTLAEVRAAQTISAVNIELLKKNAPSFHSRWSFGMQTDFSKQLSSQNKNLTVPDSKQIQDSHLGDLDF